MRRRKYWFWGGFSLLCLALAGYRNGPSVPGETAYAAVDTIATNLVVPWAMAFLPDGSLLFSERAGRIRLYRNNQLVAKPVLTIDEVETTKKMGTLGLCLHPDFGQNQYVYVAHNYKAGEVPLLKVVRYRLQHDSLQQPTVLIQGILANQNHTGCRLQFGPDRKLYITTGDADRPALAQDLKALNGKILRLNDDGSIPADNPFVARDTARKEIWSYGHRNPQGLAFQPQTGLLFSAEHGPSGGDEVNLIQKGANYGWPKVHHRDTLAGAVPPLAEYTPSVGPAEAVFYNADAMPTLKGNLLVACLRGESIIRLRLDKRRVVAQERLLTGRYGRIRALVVGPDGFIYFSTSQLDPPEGKPRPGYDMLLRLRPASSGLPLPVLEPTEVAMNASASGTLLAGRTPEALYTQLCASCHGETMRGTDRANGLYNHRYGTSLGDLTRIIRTGLPAQGMPAWEGALNADEITKLAQFVLARTTAPAPVAR